MLRNFQYISMKCKREVKTMKEHVNKRVSTSVYAPATKNQAESHSKENHRKGAVFTKRF